LKPIQIPKIPPTAPNNTDDIEKAPAPHIFGIKLPIVEKINRPRKISVFAFIF
jgi:hypothetical protein